VGEEEDLIEEDVEWDRTVDELVATRRYAAKAATDTMVPMATATSTPMVFISGQLIRNGIPTIYFLFKKFYLQKKKKK
jgi:hypothetical protein